MNTENITRMLLHHEGLKTAPYRCSAGKLTIGVGRNLDDVGITEEEARYLLANDIERVAGELDRALPWWSGLDTARREVLLDMCFNLGIGGLLKFKGMLAALETGDFATAAEEMLDSRWASQVGGRAAELATLMRGGGA